MSVNIDKKKFRKYLGMAEYASALPISLPNYYPTLLTWDYDGEWISVTTLQPNYYPAIRSCVTYQAGRSVHTLELCANIKAPTNDKNIYFFFYEPQKADRNFFQGFYTTNTQYITETGDGTGFFEQNILTGQDWTAEHKFKIEHKKDKSYCKFYIDGVLVATHTTRIADQPFEVCAIEPNGVLRTIYLRYPKGIYVDKV